MYRDRRIYFAWIFSVFILFAVLIILKNPIHVAENDPYIWILIPAAFTPAGLFFMKNQSINKKMAVAYLPVITGFIMSIILNNSIYFLVSFPIFLINALITFPRGNR